MRFIGLNNDFVKKAKLFCQWDAPANDNLDFSLTYEGSIALVSDILTSNIHQHSSRVVGNTNFLRQSHSYHSFKVQHLPILRGVHVDFYINISVDSSQWFMDTGKLV